MLFYQARDAIRDIRNPFGSIDEGSSRQKADNESEAETKLLNQAYVVIERYKKHEDVFNKLQSTRYRFMARFGRENETPFIDLNTVLNEIFIAARMLGTYYWQRQGRVQMSGDEFQKHLDEMHKYEAIFWFMGEERDEIGPKIEKIINQIEGITKEILAENNVWYKKIF